MDLRAVIVDDEPAARSRLRRLLDRQFGVTVVGEAASSREAASITASAEPDVLFVDVEMPGTSGVDFVHELSPRPAIVFTTAHAQYAVRAFEEDAVDYLLKPVIADRLTRALERVRQTIAAADGVPSPPPSRIPARIAVRRRSEIIFLAPADVTWVAAEGNYCRLYAKGTSYLLRQLIGDFAVRVGSDFVRVHRSALVNTAHVRKITGTREGGYSIVLLDSTKISIGDSYSGIVQSLLRRAL